jgi:biopolymer transport protein ExbB/TolQ
VTDEEPLSMQGDRLFEYTSNADVPELRRMLRMPALGAKDVILAELDRRLTQEVNQRMEQLNRRIVLLAQITSAAAIFTIFIALAVALHWGPF